MAADEPDCLGLRDLNEASQTGYCLEICCCHEEWMVIHELRRLGSVGVPGAVRWSMWIDLDETV